MDRTRTELLEAIARKAQEVMSQSPLPWVYPHEWGDDVVVPGQWESDAVVLHVLLGDLWLLDHPPTT